MTTKSKWMAGISAWRTDVDRDADEDLADQQERLTSLECDLPAQAIVLGELLAKHERNVSPGEFRLLKRIASRDVPGGYEWIEVEHPATYRGLPDAAQFAVAKTT